MNRSSKPSLRLTMGGLFIAFPLALAPAQAQNPFVANQGGDTIRGFSPGCGRKSVSRF
jgi:hypothetical protein